MTEQTDPLPDIKIMHGEQRTWQSEHAAWRDDLTAWMREQKLVETMLYRLENAIPDYRQRMMDHANDIAAHENRLKEYEKQLANCVKNGQQTNDCIHDLFTQHQQQAKHHAHERSEHYSFRSHHQSAMAEVKRLIKLFDQMGSD